MTAQEIKNGMTNTPWAAERWPEHETLHTIWRRPEISGDIPVLIARTCFAPASEANAAAITTAVNSTYGNGLDPENLAELYHAMVALCANTGFTRLLPKSSIPIQNILASAKLNP